MGSDKGLMLENGQARIQIVYNQLLSSFDSIYISIRKEQKSDYKNIFSQDQMIFDSSSFSEIYGPLRGLSSFSEIFPSEYFFVSACDLLNLNQNSIEILLGEFEQSPGADCYLYRYMRRPEPLFGIYHTQPLLRYTEDIKKHKKSDFSMMSLLGHLKCSITELSENDFFYLKNFNVPDEKPKRD